MCVMVNSKEFTNPLTAREHASNSTIYNLVYMYPVSVAIRCILRILCVGVVSNVWVYMSVLC